MSTLAVTTTGSDGRAPSTARPIEAPELPAEMLAPESYRSLGELLTDAMLTFKSETALIEVDRERESRRLTYLEARKESARVAAWLAQVGVCAGDRVAILLTNQARWLLAATAVLTRGGVLVPLDPKLSPGEQAALLAHAKPRVLVSESPLLRRFRDRPSLPQHVLGVDQAACPVPVTAFDELPEPPPGGPELVPRKRGDAAAIVYSSGTGGRIKGCVLTHDAYLEQLRGLMAMFPMHPGHRYFSILPTNHAIDFMVGFLAPFATGAAVVHQRTLRPEFLRSTMRTYGITHMSLVPALLTAFESAIRESMDENPAWVRQAFSALVRVNEACTRDKPNVAFSRRLLGAVHQRFGGKLELLFCGGAFVDRQRAEFFYRLGLPVAIGYGLTEACTVATLNDLRPFRADSVGRAVDGVEVRIHAPDREGVGEVWIRGRTVMQGYLDDPALTAEVLRDGWLRTGDLGWLDASHHLHLVGRSKNMIVTDGGKNVYPEDVETAFDGLPGVEELVVFASGFLFRQRGRLPDEGLVAVVRPCASGAGEAGRAGWATGVDGADGVDGVDRAGKAGGAAPVDQGRVRALLRERNRRLAEHKRVGGFLLWPAAFPKTASLKVKRQALAEAIRGAAVQPAVHPC